jgi:hypothetical protein
MDTAVSAQLVKKIKLSNPNTSTDFRGIGQNGSQRRLKMTGEISAWRLVIF